MFINSFVVFWKIPPIVSVNNYFLKNTKFEFLRTSIFDSTTQPLSQVIQIKIFWKFHSGELIIIILRANNFIIFLGWTTLRQRKYRCNSFCFQGHLS